MTPHLEIETTGPKPGWCWCGQIWLIGGIEEFREGGLLHTHTGCWARPSSSLESPRPTPGTCYVCCEHCPCNLLVSGHLHVKPCPVEGCQVRS